MAIERSRSGNGAHLWLFFSEPVLAKDLRRLAFYFLDKAAEKGRIKAKLSSYDRVFPGQDKLAEKGIGNLIQMPLIRVPSKKECSVFLDDNFKMYPDQIAYLSSVKKHTAEDVISFINTVEKKEYTNLFDSEELDYLWLRKLPTLTSKDFNERPTLYLSSGITIAKSDLSKRAYLFFLKLTSFSNPEYYETVNRTGNYYTDIPSMISLLQESESAILLPRGFENFITTFFKNNGIAYNIEDFRIQNTKLEATFKGELREEQRPIFEKMKTLENGILYASTSFGKTITAIALIAEKKERTLILVNKSDLVDQWRSSR